MRGKRRQSVKEGMWRVDVLEKASDEVSDMVSSEGEASSTKRVTSD